MIYLQIDGKEVEVKPGMTVLEAADANGIRIPRLCYHPCLPPIGSCRICVVEVQPGPPRPVPACTTQVSDNMVVSTQSEKLTRYRRQILQLQLIHHPLECPICDKAGECELQQLVQELGIMEQPYHAAPPAPKFDSQSPLIERYPDRCVNCERCVRVCNDWVGASALYFEGRGYRRAVTAGSDNMNCEHCGTCVSVCPVGALIDKNFKYKARVWELSKQRAICPYCASGCHLELNTKNGKLIRVTSSHQEPVNGTLLCSRGRFGLDMVQSQERLTQPLIRKNNEFEAVSWEEAYTFVADKLTEIKEREGARSILGIGSPRTTNESNFLFQKFMRMGIGTPHVDSSATHDHATMVRGLLSVMGHPRIVHQETEAGEGIMIKQVSGFQLGFGTLMDLRKADTVLLLGTELKNEIPLYAWHINYSHKHGKLQKLAIIAAAHTSMRKQAEIYHECEPGSYAYVIQGIVKAILKKEADKTYFTLNFPGKNRLEQDLAELSWIDLDDLTGLNQQDYEDIAISLLSSKKTSIVLGQDIATMADSNACAQYCANLLLLLGKKLKMHLSAEKANTQGCMDMGVSPYWLPGYLPLAEKDLMEPIWGGSIPFGPGKDLGSAINELAGKDSDIKACYLMGTDLLNSMPEREKTEKALQNIDFLVCQEVFLNETCQYADCVLPALSALEISGTLTNSEGRVQRQFGRVFCQGPKPDWQIIAELSTRFGYTMPYTNAREIFEEIATCINHYNQYPFDEMPRQGFWWQRVDITRFGSAKWKLKFDPTLEASTPEMLAPPRREKDYPFLLHVHKSLFQSGTLSRKASGPRKLEECGYLEMNPYDAAKLDIKDKDWVTVITETGQIQLPVKLNLVVKRKVVRTTLHFPGSQVTRIVKNSSVCPVRIETRKG